MTAFILEGAQNGWEVRSHCTSDGDNGFRKKVGSIPPLPLKCAYIMEAVINGIQHDKGMQ